MLADPVKKTKTPLFDHARMAAALTMITRIPYDAQHLPFTQVRFIKGDAAFEFEVQVPRDAVIPTTKPKAITTDQQGGGGRDEQNDEFDMDEDPLQQGQQVQQQQQQQQGQGGRGAGAGTGRGAAAPRTRTLHFEYDMATAKTTLVEDYPEEPRVPPGDRCRPMARPFCSRATTTST